MALPGVLRRRITMPIELQHERDNIFRIELTAKLRQAEFQRCQEQILHEVSRLGPVRLLFLLDGFEGWDSQDDWRDLSFFVRHGDSIARIAIVGDERWRDLALMFAAADLRKAPVEYFDERDLVKARSWLDE
jgi:stage II sporulation SpoAA-like protein